MSQGLKLNILTQNTALSLKVANPIDPFPRASMISMFGVGSFATDPTINKSQSFYGYEFSNLWLSKQVQKPKSPTIKRHPPENHG